jgi:hypothetical protein
VIGATASGGLQVTINGATESFFPHSFLIVNIDAGAGRNNVGVNALPAGVTLDLDNNTPGHIDSVTIGSNEASLSNVAGHVSVASSGGTTALAVYGTADSMGRTYTVDRFQIHVSGMAGFVDYFGEVNAVTINGGSGNNTMEVLNTEANIPVNLNAGSGTNNVLVYNSSSAVDITGNGTNYVTLGADGSLANLAGPVNISNSSNLNAPDGKSYVKINDTSDTTGRNYTISSPSIALQGGPTINLSSDVAGVTINDTRGTKSTGMAR